MPVPPVSSRTSCALTARHRSCQPARYRQQYQHHPHHLSHVVVSWLYVRYQHLIAAGSPAHQARRPSVLGHCRCVLAVLMAAWLVARATRCVPSQPVPRSPGP
jgi:hypothetical protein